MSTSSPWRRGWAMLALDPVGLLGPALVRGLAETALTMWLLAPTWPTWTLPDPTRIAIALGAHAAIVGACDGWMLGRALRTAVTPPRTGPVALPVVVGLTAAVTDALALAGGAAVAWLAAAALSLAVLTANPAAGVALVGAGALAAWVTTLVLHAWLAWAPIHAAVDRVGALVAVGRSLRQSPATLLWTLRLVLAGAVGRGLGATACLVGALPFSPWVTLTLLSRHLDPEP